MQVGNLDNSQKDVGLVGCAFICEIAMGPKWKNSAYHMLWPGRREREI